MTEWPAERADQRIAASSARLVRAAIRQSFDPLKVWQAYLATLPESSDNPTMDRVRARAWVIMNVTLNGEPMEAALRRVYAEGYVLGRLSAEHAIQQARAARKAPDSGGIDWDTWRPGNSAAAALLKPPGSLKRLLDNTGVTVRGINRTTMERLGNALADTLALGVGEKAGAKIIGAVIADPARALSITITEQARALSAASAEAYRDAGLDEQEWFANDPCAVCAQNAGKVVAIGEAFPSGHTQPPAHPYCRCALLPVIPDFEAEPQAPIRTPEGQPDMQPTEGQITTPTQAPQARGGYTPKPSRADEFVQDKDLQARVAKAYKDLGPGDSGPYGMKDAASVADVMDYHGKPTVVSSKEMDRLIADEGYTELYRGVMKQPNGPSAREMADQWRYGDKHFMGAGTYGDGSYTAINNATARNYARAQSSTKRIVGSVKKGKDEVGYILRIGLRPDAKVIDYYEAADLAKDWTKGLKAKGVSKGAITPMEDLSSWAMTHGYDAIRVPFDGVDDYLVVLNREATVVMEHVGK